MSAHPSASTTSTALQFDAADMGPGGDAGGGASACSACAAPIERYYFEANGAVVCPACKRTAESARDGTSSSRGGRVARALAFGTVAALAGALLYFGVAALTGYEIGLVAIAVGYMVGRAVNVGSHGRGGWRYQTLAVGLTYLAIGAAYFSQGMSEMRATSRGRSSAAGAPDSAAIAAIAERATPAAGDSVLALASAAPVATAAADGEAKGSGVTRLGPVAVIGAVIALLLFIAALPIVAGLSEFPQHALGLLIVAVALHQAWSMNRGVSITFTGPYRVGTAGAAASDEGPSSDSG
jgi:hypothetical protein